MIIEQTIISNLVLSEEYARKVLPFIEAEYFNNRSDLALINEIASFYEKYNSPPSKEALRVQLIQRSDLSDTDLQTSIDLVDKIGEEPAAKKEWLIEQTEKFCKEKSVYNAILKSIRIIEGTDTKLSQDAIPKLLQDALGVSFDTAVGHSYDEDVEARYDFYTKREERLPFDLDMMNRVTNGGLTRKSLTLVVAECVHPDTKVLVRIKKKSSAANEFVEGNLPIWCLRQFVESDEFDVVVDSADGWVNVSAFIEKGPLPEYVLETTDHQTRIRVSGKHLFETDSGWQYAETLADFYDQKPFKVLTKDGYKEASVFSTGRDIPVVDITVDHINHRYYTEGVSSHNSGGGKSLFLCHAAASYLASGKNVLYISLEMSEERIAERIDANLMNIDIGQLSKLSKDEFMTKFDKIKSRGNGRLIVKEYPTGAAHSGHFRGLIEELKIKKNFIPDILVIDYLGICASARLKQGSNVNTYSLLKSVSEELRALGVEYNIPVLSAMQVNRSGFGNSDIELTSISESIAVVMTSDFVFSMIRTEELDNLGQTMIKVLKNRYSDLASNRKFVLGIDRAKMKLFDLEESAQSRLSESNYQPKTKEEDSVPVFDRGRSSSRGFAAGFSDFKF